MILYATKSEKMKRRDEKFPENGFEAWGGYMQAKITKLEEQFTSRANTEENKLSDIFNGVSIYVNGYTVPSADELKTIMSRHGGVYHTYQRSDDYIIASNLPDTKVKKLSLAKIVKPEWITDSVASNRLLDYRDYLLYRNSKTQTTINFNKVIKSELSLPDSKSPFHFDTTNTVNEKPNLNNEVISKTLYFTETTMLVNHTVSKKSDTNLIIKYNENSSVDETSELKSVQTNCMKSEQSTTKTAVDPNFISEFYNNSRLHHISQLGACFKQLVNDLRETSDFLFPARIEFKEKVLALNNLNVLSQTNFQGGKTIMHIDMDCFFVSVGLRKQPDLRGKPVAVTHSKGGRVRPKRSGVDRNAELNLYRQKQVKKLGKVGGAPDGDIEIETRADNITEEDEPFGSMSEIASCSYEARAKGVTNGMFMGAALRLCPDIQTIPYDFDGYKEVAYTLYNTIAQYTLDIEAVSCDEMYVDCTELLKKMNISVQDFATVLRDEIKNKTGCPCSTGFGGNRLQARLATKRAKPDGQFFLSEELVEDFIFDIKLSDLPGVGRQTAQKLESLGHKTCGSLQNLSLASLQCHLGNKMGAQLYNQCRGHDTNPLTFYTVRKSVSAEVNYGIRFENNEQCVEFLKQLSAEVHSRMQQFKVVGKCIILKLMVRAEEAPVETAKFLGHGFCNVINKSTSLNKATDNAEVITKEVISLCKKQNIDPKEMRGIGIQITKLESTTSDKQSKGAISKFLLNKPIKLENKILETENKLKLTTETILKKNEPKVKLATTPKKIHVSSPEKKSPIIGSLKSPPGKRRGRPPKNVSNKHQASATARNLMNKFLQGQIDFKESIAVENIKKEQKTEQEQPQGLLGLSWEKVRELLRAWLESGQAPLLCDINLIVAYMTEMVINKKIDKLNILINFLKRRTRETNSVEWNQVYDHVIEHVQNAMIAVYGKKLYICD